MQKVEDLSRSVSNLGQAIRDSYNFAYNSPAKAMNTLTTWTEYLQTKSTQSGLFVAGFLLTVLDLLKNEHMKHLIESILGILEALVLLLQTEDCKLLLKSLINIAASEAIQLLIQCFGKIIRSLFYLMRTQEIEKFKSMARDLIRQLRKSLQIREETQKDTKQKQQQQQQKQQQQQQRRSKRRSKNGHRPPKAPNSARKDSYKNRRNINSRFKNGGFSKDDSYYCRSEPYTPPKTRSATLTDEFDKEFDEEKSQPQQTHHTQQQQQNQSWLQLPGFVGSMLGSPPRPRDLTDELSAVSEYESRNGDDSDGDDSSSYTSATEDATLSEAQVAPPLQLFNEMNEHVNLSKKKKDKTNKKFENSKKRKSKKRKHVGYSSGENNNNNNKKTSDIRIGDWVLVMEKIDELENSGKISENISRNLRKLVWQQNVQLMIIYQCYKNNVKRFVDCCVDLLASHNETTNYLKMESNISRKLETTLRQLLIDELKQNNANRQPQPQPQPQAQQTRYFNNNNTNTANQNINMFKQTGSSLKYENNSVNNNSFNDMKNSKNNSSNNNNNINNSNRNMSSHQRSGSLIGQATSMVYNMVAGNNNEIDKVSVVGSNANIMNTTNSGYNLDSNVTDSMSDSDSMANDEDNLYCVD